MNSLLQKGKSKMNYNKVIQVKVTDEQFNLILQEAKRIGLPRTSYIRFIVLNQIKSKEVSPTA